MLLSPLILHFADLHLELLLHIWILILVLKLKAKKLFPGCQEIFFRELHKLFILDLFFFLLLDLAFNLLYLLIYAIDIYKNLLKKLIFRGANQLNDLILIIHQLLLVRNNIFFKTLLLLDQILLGKKLFPWEEVHFFNS